MIKYQIKQERSEVEIEIRRKALFEFIDLLLRADRTEKLKSGDTITATFKKKESNKKTITITLN